MAKRKEALGKRFGRLLVVEEAGKNKSGRYCWKCLCDCGNVCVVSITSLLRGGTRSCGCFQKEELRKRSCTHGKTKTRLYRIWCGMKSRCNNINDKDYKNYGRRGICVYKKWSDSFELFEEWALNNGYFTGLTIDRINVNGNYDPDNCRWATNKVQCNNKRENRLIEYKGITKNVTEWSEELSINKGTLRSRIDQMGIVPEVALSTPVRIPVKVTYKGETKTYREWEKELGFTRGTLRGRIEKGWELDRAFEEEVGLPKRSNNRLLTFNGVTMPISVWAVEKNIPYSHLWYRVRILGWSDEKALTVPYSRK